MEQSNNHRVSQMIQVQQLALELLQRSLSISKNGISLVDDEKIRDTLIDLHNYAAMAIMLLDEDMLRISNQPIRNC